jgi:tetratricopeptide (TPR) repeat protein
MNRSTACLKIFTTVLIFFCSIFVFGNSKENFDPDITNPFHDVFHLYYNNGKREAVKLLKKQFNNTELKNQAYINYGLISEYEGDFPEAEKYFLKALNNNERIAILYLYDLYKNYKTEKAAEIFSRAQSYDKTNWIHYERAVISIENGDTENALGHLSNAIDAGFASTALLENDPAFSKLKNSLRFRQLAERTKNNRLKSKSLSEILKSAKYEYESGKPYGFINQLEIAAYYENTGQDNEALKILSDVTKINSKHEFRDNSIALYRLARINAKNGKERSAKKYLKEFISNISSTRQDTTGFKDILLIFYKDIIRNDIYLKNTGKDLL